VLSLICEALNHLSGGKPGGMSPLIAFSPLFLILIPLLTSDQSYWDRIKEKYLIASLLLLDFKNNPTTAFTCILSLFLAGLMGYMSVIVFLGPRLNQIH
jgi:hypothetical protein